MEIKDLFEAFKSRLDLLAMLIINVLLFKLLLKKEEMLAQIMDGQKKDVERFSKMLVFLELLVSRKDKGGTP